MSFVKKEYFLGMVGTIFCCGITWIKSVLLLAMYQGDKNYQALMHFFKGRKQISTNEICL